MSNPIDRPRQSKLERNIRSPRCFDIGKSVGTFRWVKCRPSISRKCTSTVPLSTRQTKLPYLGTMWMARSPTEFRGARNNRASTHTPTKVSRIVDESDRTSMTMRKTRPIESMAMNSPQLRPNGNPRAPTRGMCRSTSLGSRTLASLISHLLAVEVAG